MRIVKESVLKCQDYNVTIGEQKHVFSWK